MLSRFLPPLVVVAVLFTVMLRYRSSPEREQERKRIEARWGEAADMPRARSDVEDQIARYVTTYGGGAEDRWFGARAYVKVGRVDQAAATIFVFPTLARDPATPRRFGETLLRGMGFDDDENLEGPYQSAPLALLALAEGGLPEARKMLAEIPRTQSINQFLMLYYGAFMRGTREVQRILVEALRARKESPFEIATAFAALSDEPYPERGEDLAVLLDVVAGPMRTEPGQRPMWAASCFALGRSGDPDARLLLEGQLARLAESAAPQDREDRAVVAASLVAAGSWEAEEAAWPAGQPPVGPVALSWYAEAVLHRLSRGDPRARPAFERLWRETPSEIGRNLRPQIATRLFLQDDMPGDGVPVEEVHRTLLDPAAPPEARMIALAFDLRRGAPGALDALVKGLRSVFAAPGLDPDPLYANPTLTHALVTAGRALYLYGGS